MVHVGFDNANVFKITLWRLFEFEKKTIFQKPIEHKTFTYCSCVPWVLLFYILLEYSNRVATVFDSTTIHSSILDSSFNDYSLKEEWFLF